MVCSGSSLDGVVGFPAEFAARYRQRGYWEDRPLIDHFLEVFTRFASRTAIADGDRVAPYAELDEQSERIALNLLDLGLQPLDRIVLQLPNTPEFAQLYFGLQHIGAIPIIALPSHRFREVNQFVQLSGAVAAATPIAARDVSFIDVIDRIRANSESLRLHFVLGADAPARCIALSELITRTPQHSPADLRRIQSDLNPCDPAVFQLSGGTTGIPKLIPRTHTQRLCL